MDKWDGVFTQLLGKLKVMGCRKRPPVKIYTKMPRLDFLKLNVNLKVDLKYTNIVSKLSNMLSTIIL